MGTGSMHKNLVKFSHVVFELHEQTDGLKHAHFNTSHPSSGQSNNDMSVFSVRPAWRRLAGQVPRVDRECRGVHQAHSAGALRCCAAVAALHIWSYLQPPTRHPATVLTVRHSGSIVHHMNKVTLR